MRLEFSRWGFCRRKKFLRDKKILGANWAFLLGFQFVLYWGDGCILGCWLNALKWLYMGLYGAVCGCVHVFVYVYVYVCVYGFVYVCVYVYVYVFGFEVWRQVANGKW